MDQFHGPLKGILKDPQMESILDLGCGSGEIARYLHESIYYTGIDTNEHFIHYANKTFGGDRRHFICADAFQVNDYLKRKYKTLLLSMFIHHNSDQEILSLWNKLKDFIEKQVIVLEPTRSEPLDLRSKIYIALEDGKNVKTQRELEELFKDMNLTVTYKKVVRQRNLISVNALYVLEREVMGEI